MDDEANTDGVVLPFPRREVMKKLGVAVAGLWSMAVISVGKHRIDQQPTFHQPPRDLNLDGFFEDINGDGELDQSDVFHHFFSHDEPVLQEFRHILDYDHDGTVALADSYDLLSRDIDGVDRPQYDEYVDINLYTAGDIDAPTGTIHLITTSLNSIGISPISWMSGGRSHQTGPSYPQLYTGDVDVSGDTLEEVSLSFRDAVAEFGRTAEDANILLHPTVDDQVPAISASDNYSVAAGVSDIDFSDGVPLFTDDYAVTRPLAALYRNLGIDGGESFEATITRNDISNSGDDHATIAPPTVDSQVEPDSNDVYYSTILPYDVAREQLSSI